jgi:DNA-directed RNA polymerase specialized sigma24 family protein
MHFRRRRWKVFQSYDETDERQRRGDPPRVEDLAEQHRALRRLADHLAELKPTLRIPLVLVLVHGYSVPEVAAILELSYAAAKKRLYRGRRELTVRLRDDPYFAQIRRELAP